MWKKKRRFKKRQIKIKGGYQENKFHKFTLLHQRKMTFTNLRAILISIVQRRISKSLNSLFHLEPVKITLWTKPTWIQLLSLKNSLKKKHNKSSLDRNLPLTTQTSLKSMFVWHQIKWENPILTVTTPSMPKSSSIQHWQKNILLIIVTHISWINRQKWTLGEKVI